MFFHRCLRILAALPLSLVLSLPGVAQPIVWSDIAESAIVANPNDRLIVPDRYRTLRLDFVAMRAHLITAPTLADYLQGTPGISVDFPLPDGGMATFEVWDAPVLHPDLGKAFPEIRSFAGKSRSKPGMTARFDISPKGLHAMLFNPGGSSIFIDPYARGNTADYLCYFRKDFVKRTGDRFVCHVSDLEKVELPAPPPYSVSDRAGDCGNLRVYRLALACTGEYANYHGSFGADKAPALAAMNTSMTRVNGVFERDCGLTMSIVPNDTAIIFTSPANDPYSNNNGSAMLNQNQTTCNNIIGAANYDIGHVFSTGGGGVATLNSPCSNSIKARGVTGSPNPIGDPFDIDYVAHEMGHQFGANHTQFNNCNRVNAAAMEPGSASTIMGYAGICAPDVQSNSDDYFHAYSLFEIGGFVTGGGNSCAVKVPTGNSKPVITALTNRTIPHSTPFILTASATDPNGDAMTYCWEQMNNYTTNETMPPASTNMTGPMFRSLNQTTESSRYFPYYEAVLNNYTPTWEVLPSVGRSMSFRVTVRDNNPAAGCTSEANMTVTTSASVGPFEVVTPNGGENYPSNSTQTVTWNVAGSNGSPVNCANVSILLSTDGGNNYATLLASTPNDGSQQVTYNVSPTTQARIAILAVGNVFYDISNSNFTISAPLPVELVSFSARRQTDGIRLDWNTATETNNRGFRIERSADGTGQFEPIGWMDGHGSTTLPHSYTFLDTDLPRAGVLYYRLRQTDFDGSEQLTDIRAVLLENDGQGNRLTVWPNPAGAKIRLQLPPGATQETSRVLVLNPAGVPVLQLAALPDSGEIDLQNLLPGVYTVHVTTGNQSFSGQFIRSADH